MCFVPNKLITCHCCLLVTFTNSLDPDQYRQNIAPDLDPNCLTLVVFLKELVENINFEKKKIKTVTDYKISWHFLGKVTQQVTWAINLKGTKRFLIENKHFQSNTVNPVSVLKNFIFAYVCKSVDFNSTSLRKKHIYKQILQKAGCCC